MNNNHLVSTTIAALVAVVAFGGAPSGAIANPTRPTLCLSSRADSGSTEIVVRGRGPYLINVVRTIGARPICDTASRVLPLTR